MARKGSKAKSTPTKYKNAFNVRSVGKSYLSLGIGTKLVFNTNPNIKQLVKVNQKLLLMNYLIGLLVVLTELMP